MKNLNYTKKFHKALCLSALLILNYLSYSQDKHIDPSADRTLHKITFTKHINVGNTIINAPIIDAFLKFGSERLQACDDKVNDEQDVACQVSFERDGSVKTFGAINDGLDIIDNDAEADIVDSHPERVKFVTALMYNGGIQTGLTSTAAGSMKLAAQLNGKTRSTSEYGQTFVHEFGHAQGLDYERGESGAPALIGKPFMHPNPGPFYEVNLAECKAFHGGRIKGTSLGKNRPVNITYVVDNTGSMGEEIEGVKNGITAALNFFSTFTGNTCNYVYRLVSFKDDVTPRAPTTDLKVIKDQVAALVASGGGACPEASVEAVEAIQESVKDKGVVFLFTDASPHAGTNLTSVATALKARGVNVSVLLSGDCTSSSLRSSLSKDIIPYSDNHDASSSITSLASIPPNPTAIEAYSFLANETGGVFSFIPQVNSGNPADRLKYENMVYNLIVGGVAPAITNIEPGKGPAGGTLAVTISSSKTNFNSSTKLAFNDAGVTVKEIKVLSPTKLEAVITIGSLVAPGIKDVTATTNIGGGMTEKAEGKGLLQVTAPPSTPTILSISPSSGSAGQKLTVRVTGINTHFTNSSVLNLGSGITILSSAALNSKELKAEIQVSPAATIGFRNVTVTTGTEVANENVPGPFLVVASTCNLQLSTSLTHVSCFNGNNGAINLTVTNGTAPITYTWSNGAKTEDLAGLKAGSYNVTVTDANGCKNNASITLSQPATAVNCSISVSPNPTVAGQAVYTIFAGFGPQSVTLTGSATGGAGALSYSWGSAGTGSIITVTPTTTTTYTLTVRDANGCTCIKTVTIQVKDARCGNKNDKVNVCHNGHGNCISRSAVQAHLNHGDILGPCVPNPAMTKRIAPTQETSEAIAAKQSGELKEELIKTLRVSLYPNPFTKSTKLQYSLPYDCRVSIIVYDITGRTVATLANGEKKAGTYTVDFANSKPGAGNYYYRIHARSKEKEFTKTGSMVQLE